MLKKPKVAIVTPGTFPIPSPRSSSVERVVVQVSSLLRQDVDFMIFGKRSKGISLYERDNGIAYFRPSFGHRMQYLNKVADYLRKRHISIIQIENRPRYVKYFKQRFRNRKVWLCLHSTTYMSKPHIALKELSDSLNYADKIIVNSHFLKEKLLMSVPRMAHKVEVNYLGVNQHQFMSNWSDFGQKLKEDHLKVLGYEGKRIILFVGRLIEIKGVHHLLKVMPQIIAQHPNAVLVIVGSAYYGKHHITPYVSRLHRLGNTMPHNVRFIPFVSHSDIQKWFNIADIAVVPSFEDEAFGLVNVEAMSSGVPVIATKSGGMREIIVDGETGYLIDPHDIDTQLVSNVVDLLSNEQKRRALGEASIQRVADHFTWQHTAQRFLDLYLKKD